MHNRYAKVIVSNELFLDFAVQGHTWGKGEVLECIKGIPEGCKVIKAYPDGYLRGIVFVLEHESFEPVPDGSEIPTIIPIMHRTVTP